VALLDSSKKSATQGAMNAGTKILMSEPMIEDSRIGGAKLFKKF
jgi:hypothetical protein